MISDSGQRYAQSPGFRFHAARGIGIGLDTTGLEHIDTGEDTLSVDFRLGGVLLQVGVAF